MEYYSNLVYPQIDENKVKDIAKETGLSSPFVRLLFSRGYRDVNSINNFINPSFDSLFSPFLLPNIDLAINRIIEAIDKKEKILIVGHSDADGITGTAIAIYILQNLCANFTYRLIDTKTTKLECDEEVSLAITIDCGTSGIWFNKDIDIIITDHHEILKNKPYCYAFVNPKLGYVFPYLSGSGVIYKVMQGLVMKKLGLSAKQWHSISHNLLSFVAIGILTDKVEIISENRAFLKLGINGKLFEKINISDWIKVLSCVGSDGVKLLLNFDQSLWEESMKKAILRESETEENYSICISKLEKINNFIFVYDERLNSHAIGICASKIMNKYKLPTMVITKKDNILVGEARSPEGLNLIHFFNDISHLFLNYGGHKLAAGFSMEESNLSELKRYLNLVVFLIKDTIEIDAIVELNEINEKFLNEIQLLQPYGRGNPTPTFLTKNISSDEIKLFNLPCGKFDVIWGVNQQGNITIKSALPTKSRG